MFAISSDFLKRYATVTTLLQEEDLQEIVSKISSKRAEYDKARAQMAEVKASYEKAEQEYKQRKEQINTVFEDADPVKVIWRPTQGSKCPRQVRTPLYCCLIS